MSLLASFYISPRRLVQDSENSTTQTSVHDSITKRAILLPFIVNAGHMATVWLAFSSYSLLMSIKCKILDSPLGLNAALALSKAEHMTEELSVSSAVLVYTKKSCQLWVGKFMQV